MIEFVKLDFLPIGFGISLIRGIHAIMLSKYERTQRMVIGVLMKTIPSNRYIYVSGSIYVLSVKNRLKSQHIRRNRNYLTLNAIAIHSDNI